MSILSLCATDLTFWNKGLRKNYTGLIYTIFISPTPCLDLKKIKKRKFYAVNDRDFMLIYVYLSRIKCHSWKKLRSDMAKNLGLETNQKNDY